MGIVQNKVPDAPVRVSANYTLSFDALHTSLKGIDAHILVPDTDGVNVWCAAGKGTFGTDEIVRRVEKTGLDEVVVTKRTVFRVEFGPVRSSDLPEYLWSVSLDRPLARMMGALEDI